MLSRLMLCLVFVAPIIFCEEKLPEGVQLITYKGWPESLSITSTQNSNKVVIVNAVGGRILHYGPQDENLMFEVEGSDGKTLANTKGGFWVGGYNLDIGPEIVHPPDHPQLWMGQYKWKATASGAVVSTSEPDTVTGVQLEKKFAFDPKTGALIIDGSMKNTSAKDVSYCLWDRTLCKGGGFAFFPLNKKSSMAQGWAARVKRYDPGAFNTTTPSSPNVKIIDGVLVMECNGPDGKIGADSDAGWMAYVRGRQLLVKSFAYDPKGKYTDAGNSVEVYWSPQVAEIEPLSPEVTLKPGADYKFREVWQLIKLDDEIKTFEQARALVDRAASEAAKVRALATE